ncbi:hypothetical protein WCE02_14535 [Pseudomonas juntendi]|uniref:hypothetical protein n=1 Tax=Pseudomonas juntendi TaxID=2666183 RepID=UPI0034D5A157
MEIKNNPTGRLLDILEKARRIPDNARTRDAWAQIFECEKSDTSSLLNGLAQLINLIAEAKKATERHAPGDQTIYLAPFPHIENLLSRVNFDQQWNSVKAHVNDKMISGLEFGSHMLSFSYGQSAFEQKEIQSLLEGISALLAECLETQLPDELKRFFAKNIEGLRSALIAYKISGTEGVQEEIDRIGGAIFRHRSEIENAKASTETGAFVEKFFNLVSRINDSVQLAQNVQTIGLPMMLMLSQIPK